jgi:hypothetical protein
MKKTLLNMLLISASVITIHSQSFAQSSNSGDFTRAGVDDGNKLANGFFNPMLKAFGTSMNGGWFNSAKVHGAGGFSLTVSANAAFAPTSEQTFDVNALGLRTARVTSPNPRSATIFGAEKDTASLTIYGKSPFTGLDTPFTTFSLPGGSGVNIFGVPTVQLAVGVGFGTEVAVRFFPQTKVGDQASVGLFGFAVKHDFKQWIPAIKEMPFDLSAMFGYTGMNANIGLEPMKVGAASKYTYSPEAGKVYDQNKIDFKSSAWTLNVLISKKLSVFTPYLGLGYQYSKTTLKMAGTFPVTTFNNNMDTSKLFIPDPLNGDNNINPKYSATDPNAHPKVVQNLNDPISLEGIASGFRATLGFRLKLAVFTIHADYTFALYNVASVGVGLHLQSIKPFKL